MDYLISMIIVNCNIHMNHITISTVHLGIMMAKSWYFGVPINTKSSQWRINPAILPSSMPTIVSTVTRNIKWHYDPGQAATGQNPPSEPNIAGKWRFIPLELIIIYNNRFWPIFKWILGQLEFHRTSCSPNAKRIWPCRGSSGPEDPTSAAVPGETHRSPAAASFAEPVDSSNIFQHEMWGLTTFSHTQIIQGVMWEGT